MELNNRYGGISPRAIRNIKYQAAKLARSGSLPGMDKEDIEQELMLDLLRRRDRLRIPGSSRSVFRDDGDHRSDVIAINIPTSSRSAFRDDRDQMGVVLAV
jgi:hypothetical protein